MRDTGIAMLPGTAFSQVPELLTMRFCFVDFDGGKALEYVNNHPNYTRCEDWWKPLCPNIIQGVDKICTWLHLHTLST